VGLLPSHIRLLLRLQDRFGGFEGPVMTLGNQDLFASEADLRTMFAEVGVTPREPAEVPLHTSPVLREFFGEKSQDYVHARVFFDMLGLDGYADLDKFPDDEPVIRHDLNDPVPDDLRGRFGLVLDGGTIEHVFDIAQALRNVVAMVRVGGCVVQFNPHWHPDHGFYSLNPCLFYDFFGACGFDEMTCYVLQGDLRNVLDPQPCFEYRPGMEYQHLLDPERTPVLCFAARKVADVPTVNPTQDFYSHRRGDDAPLDVPPSPPGAGSPNGAGPLERMRRGLYRWRSNRIKHWERLGRL
jgi:hypothetical protein